MDSQHEHDQHDQLVDELQADNRRLRDRVALLDDKLRAIRAVLDVTTEAADK